MPGLLIPVGTGDDRARQGHAIEQPARLVVDDQRVFKVNSEEAGVAGVAKKREEVVEVAAHVEEADGVGVNPKLSPGEYLEEFIERSDAAGQSDEPSGDVGHEFFSLVHGVDDFEPVDAVVTDLLVEELLGDDAGDSATALEGGVCDGAHEP